MPRPRRRCSKVVDGRPCRNFQPCKIKEHQRGWAAAKSDPLPGNWGSLVKLVKMRSGGRCEQRTFGVRCVAPGSEVDHIINRAEWPKGLPGVNDFHPDISHPKNNLQHLCKRHHKEKTDAERSRANRRKSC